MTDRHQQKQTRTSHLAAGISIALAVFVADQAHKWWMLGPYDIAARGKVELTGFLDLVLIWNRGISYGLLTQNSETGRILLIIASLLTVLALFAWMVLTHYRLVGWALGLIIGGALGNAADRLTHGAVADFFLLHAYGFYWYVFNLADIAIVAGVVMLLYDSLISARRRTDRTV